MGSTKRPNKDTEVENMTEAMTTLLPVFQEYGAMTGDMTPMNNLLADWAKSRDLNPARYQLQMMPPPAPAPAAGGEAPPEEGGAAAPAA